MIEIKNAKKQFNDQVIFEHLNLKIETCGIHMIQGISGSGKTTLLNILAGFDHFSEGELLISETPSIIFQNYELIQELNVKENLYLPQKVFKNHSIQHEQLILDTLELNELMEHYPSELSGGQKQRVGIARALFLNPRLILCDEPTESLDIDNKYKVMNLFKLLSNDCCIVMVSHDKQMIDEFADDVYSIENYQIIRCKSIKKEVLKDNRVEKKLCFSNVIKIINKICLKSNVFSSLLIALLTVSLFTLSDYESILVSEQKQKKALIVDQIFIDNSILNNAESIKKLDLNPIIRFKGMHFDAKSYRYSILPIYKNAEYYLKEGKMMEGREVLVNQTLANKLGNQVVNRPVQLSFWINDEIYAIDTKIVGVVEEEVYTPLMYYLPNEFDVYLKEIGLYEKHLNSASLFMKKIPYESIGEYLETVKEFDYQCFQPLYDQQTIEAKNKSMYALVFKIITVMMLIAVVFFILVYLNRETDGFLRTNSILAAMGIDCWKLNIVYVLLKMFYFTLIYCIFIIAQRYGAQFLGEAFLSHRMMIKNLAIFIYGLYTVDLCFNLRKMKKKNISQLLKIEN